MQATQQIIDILYFLNSNAGATEFDVAKRFFNGRVLSARQSLSYLLWSGVIIGNRFSGFDLTPMAKVFYSEATKMCQNQPVKIVSKK